MIKEILCCLDMMEIVCSSCDGWCKQIVMMVVIVVMVKGLVGVVAVGSDWEEH